MDESLLSVSLKIEQNLDDIAKNGSLHERKDPGRKPSWILRYRTRCPKTNTRRQRSITLGKNIQLLDLVTQIIATRENIKDRRRGVKQTAKQERNCCREMTKIVLGKVQGSVRYKRTVARAFRQYFNSTPDPSVSGFMPSLEKPPLKRQKRGRPYKRRLW